MTKVKRWYFRFSIVFAVGSFLMMGLLDAKASNDHAPPETFRRCLITKRVNLTLFFNQWRCELVVLAPLPY